MNFDYTDFFDFQDADPGVLLRVREDFSRLLASHLSALGIDPKQTDEVARLLWHDMTGPLRHYHSPIHLLAMFAAAEQVGMRLTDADRLAIWFHDSLYNPAAPRGKNESDSAEYLLRVMGGSCIPPAVLQQAAETVRWTAQHLHDDVPAEHHRVMDLDLAGFSSPPASFAKQSAAVRREFPFVSQADFVAGTSHLFRGILARQSIYRTSQFTDREPIARQQLQRELVRLAGLVGPQ